MTKMEVLEQLKSGKIKIEEANALLNSMEQRSAGPFTMKVSEKGAITFRGVPGASVKFGMTLYAKGVQFILDHEKEIRAFIEKNKGQLSWEKAKAAA